jgi:WD40 repeat protein
VASGKELFAKELPAKADGFGIAFSHTFALSPDGKLLAICEWPGYGPEAKETSPAQIWQVDDPLRAPTTLESSIGAENLLFSPDGTRLAAGHGRKGGAPGFPIIRLWDTATGKRQVDVRIIHAFDMAFSPDGTRLAVIKGEGISGQTKIQVWDCISPEELKLLHATPGPDMSTTSSGMKYLAFSPDGGRLAFLNSAFLTSDRRSVRIVESAIGKEHQTVKSSMFLNFVVFSADGARVRAAGFLKRENVGGLMHVSGSAVREWAAQPLRESAPKPAKEAKEITVWSPDGNRRAVLKNSSIKPFEGIRILDRAGHLIRVFSEHTAGFSKGGGVINPVFSPGGRLVYSRDGKADVKIWETDTGKVRWEANLKTLADATSPLQTSPLGIAFSPDGRFISLPSAGGIKIVSAADFREKSTVAGTDPARFPIPECIFSPDGRRLVIVDCPGRFRPGVNNLKLDKRQLKVWDVHAGREIQSTTYLGDRVQVIFGPNGRYFALCSSGQEAVTIFDAATGKEQTVLKIDIASAAPRPTVVFSPDGSQVVVAKPEGLWEPRGIEPTVWETATGKLLYRIEAHPGALFLEVAFSPDGKRIATGDLRGLAGGQPGSIKLWDAASGRQLLSLKVEQVSGTMSFSPDGHRLLLQTPEGEVMTWDATPR